MAAVRPAIRCAPGHVEQGAITELLERWSLGDAESFNALFPLVYDELKSLADHYLRQERSGHTLQPTALVHEAYLRLRGVRELRVQSRAYFYGAAACVMRRVLVDHARRRGADKRNDGGGRVELTAALEQPVDVRMDLLALSDALDALEQIAPDKARVVELRYFGGLSVDETAEFMRISPATVKRHFAFARAWLFRRLEGSQ
jgi:RNA polymerase sigma factor (TIGR02999 family)